MGKPDKDGIQDLLDIARSPEGLAKAQATAAKHLPGYPHNGCAITLSVLLRTAGIEVKLEADAGDLVKIIEKRGWVHVKLGDQQPGDIGVTKDLDHRNPGADHIYLVVERVDRDEMLIADNQEPRVHPRYASGRNKTPTDYFLRAPGDVVGV